MDKTFTVVARHQDNFIQPGGAFHSQLQRQRALPTLFGHRHHNAGGADNRNAAQNTEPMVVGFLCPLFTFRGKDFDIRAPFRADHFTHRRFDGLTGRAVNRRVANRQTDTFARHFAHADAAAQRDSAAVIKLHTGKNQHPVGGVHVIATIFANRGGCLLAFNHRHFDIEMQRDTGRRNDRNLVNNVLTQHHQRRDFCRRGSTRSGGVTFAIRLAFMPDAIGLRLAHADSFKR
ncbi:hypothetical protein D3C75_731330 [compost metagenome]